MKKWINSYADSDRVENVHWLQKIESDHEERSLPLPFMDQMLERLAGQAFYCFLDGYSGYNQIAVSPDGQ